MRKVCTEAVKSITEKLRPPPTKLSTIPGVETNEEQKWLPQWNFYVSQEHEAGKFMKPRHSLGPGRSSM